MNSLAIVKKILFDFIKGLIFILPLFFLPWLDNAEIGKHQILFLFSFFIFFFYFLKSLMERKVFFRKTPLDVPLLVFFLAVFVSSIFSVDSYSSFFGFFENSSNTCFALLSFVVFYFAIINTADKKEDINELLDIFIKSYGVVVFVFLLSLTHIFGIFSNKQIFYGLNLSGQGIEALSVLSAFVAILVFGLLHFNQEDGNTKQGKFYNIIFFLCFLVVLIINFYLAWWVLLVGFIFALFVIKRNEKNNFLVFLKTNKIIWLVLICVLFFIFVDYSGKNFNPGKMINREDLNTRTYLDYKNSIDVVYKNIQKNPILGSGPETFSYVFSKERGAGMNELNNWQLRYGRASSYVMELASGSGLLGIFSYLLFISLLVYLAIFYFYKNSSNLTSSVAPAFFTLIFFHFFYEQQIATQLLFWLLVAVFMFDLRSSAASSRDKFTALFGELKIDQDSKKITHALTISFFIIIFTVWFYFLGVSIKYFVAEIKYKKSRMDPTMLIQAANLNPNRYDYKLKIAEYYLQKFKSESSKMPQERNEVIIRSCIDNSVEWARSAVFSSPFSVIAHETLGMVYREVKSFAVGSEAWAIKSFENAFELEPSNPVLATELGKLYLASNLNEKAKDKFEFALELKKDYYDAKFGLAKAYIKEGRDDEALVLLNELVHIASDPELLYEQGRLYYNKGEISKAINKFAAVVYMVPNHANALYSLGLALELVNREQEALDALEKVLELNPGNQEVLQRIKKLENR